MLNFLKSKKEPVPEYSYYKSCKYLPIFYFNEVQETGDIRYLLKLKDYEELPEKYDKRALKEAWQEINFEYAELGLEDSENRLRFSIDKQIKRLEFEFEHIQMCLDFLQHGWDDEIVKLIKGYPSFSSKYKLIKQKPLFPQLERIQKQSKNYISRINMKKAEFKALNPDNKNTKKQTLAEIAAILSKHVGYHLDTKKITVIEWQGIINNYTTAIEHGRRTRDNSTNRTSSKKRS